MYVQNHEPRISDVVELKEKKSRSKTSPVINKNRTHKKVAGVLEITFGACTVYNT